MMQDLMNQFGEQYKIKGILKTNQKSPETIAYFEIVNKWGN